MSRKSFKKATKPLVSTAVAVSPKPPAESGPAKPPMIAAPQPGEKAPVLTAPLKVNVIFVLVDPAARHVVVRGQFNSWSPDATPMKRHDDGHWEATVALAPGRYEYKFFVNGEWIPDPLAHDHVWNSHGTLNSVIEVRG